MFCAILHTKLFCVIEYGPHLSNSMRKTEHIRRVILTNILVGDSQLCQSLLFAYCIDNSPVDAHVLTKVYRVPPCAWPFLLTLCLK